MGQRSLPGSLYRASDFPDGLGLDQLPHSSRSVVETRHDSRHFDAGLVYRLVFPSLRLFQLADKGPFHHPGARFRDRGIDYLVGLGAPSRSTT